MDVAGYFVDVRIPFMFTVADAKRVENAKNAIINTFSSDDWSSLARVLGEAGNCITAHPRLLRSLYFGDEDYSGCVSEALFSIMSTDRSAFERLEDYLRFMKNADLEYAPEVVRDGFRATPKVFSIPSGFGSGDTCAIMMPFAPEFEPVRAVIKDACDAIELRPVIADEVWETPTIVQDVFNMIFTARIVVADFSDLNPNVMYELGIAHTLGKDVVPITQPMKKLPFDVAHYHTISYENTKAGLPVLRRKLEQVMRGLLKPAH